MIIIVDSGATKADWKIIDGHQSQTLHTMGLSPIFHTEHFMAAEVRSAFAGQVAPEQVQQVFYYGTGCWDADRKAIVARALRQVFTNAEIEVEHDLLGAARSVCGNDPGVACIIGTGSNSCLFDGEKIVDNVTNLGYMLGDEASGVYLGKKLIQAYFYREIPAELMMHFDNFHPGGKSTILDKVYGQEPPNVYLASFVPFFVEYKQHIYIQKLVYDAFANFIDRHVRKYDGHMRLPIHFIGSVAWLFQHIMRIVLEERAMRAGNFIQKPIDDLAAFHVSSSMMDVK